MCVSSLKQVKTDPKWSQIVLIGQEWSAYGKVVHEMGPNKYPNILKFPIID